MAFKRDVVKPKGLTYGEIIERYILLDRVKGLIGEKLCFARRKNLMQLRSFEKINSQSSRIPITPEYEKYQKELSELRSNYLLTDSDGKAILQQGYNQNGQMENQPIVDIANSALKTKTDELNTKYKDAITEREDDWKAYKEFIDEVVPEDQLPKIHMVKSLEDSNLTQEQVDAIAWFIDDDETEDFVKSPKIEKIKK